MTPEEVLLVASLDALAISSSTEAIRKSSATTVANVSISLSSLSGVLPIANGGTNNSVAYTAGSVIFSDGTSLTQNNANFFWDNTNNRLGIGTTTPLSMLSLSSTNPTLRLTDTTASAKSLLIDVDANLAQFREIAGASGSLMVLDLANNRVGIGTASPANALDVAGTIMSTTGVFRLISTSYGMTASVGYTELKGSTGVKITNTSAVAILTTVDTTNISTTMTNATGATTSASFVINTNSLTTGTGLYAASSTLTSGLLVDLQISGTAAAASQTALNILTAGANATNAITTYGAQISNTHTNATSGTNVALYLNASGATTANYGLIVNAGNVGIGTTAPGALLDLGLAGTTLGVVRFAGSTSGNVTIQPAATAGTWTLTLPTTGGTNTYFLQTNGSGITTWAQVGLTTSVTGVLPLANGGTNNSVAYTAGSVIFSDGTSLTQNNANFFWDNVNFRLGLMADISSLSTTLQIGKAGTIGTIGIAGETSGLLTIQSAATGTWTLTFPTSGGTNNYALTTNGSGTTSWSQISLTAAVTGVLPLANGGTNKALTADNGGIVYTDSDSMEILASTVTAGKVLQSGSSAAPSWSTPTYPSASGTAGKILRSDGTNNVYTTATFADTYTASNLLYSNGSNTVTGLATANYGILNTSSSGVPSVTATPLISTSLEIGVAGTATGVLKLTGTTSGTVTTTVGAAAGTWTFTLPTSGGTNKYALTTNGSGTTSWSQISLTAAVTGVLPLANGGTNANLTASNGGIFYSTATAGAILSGTATAGQILQSGASGAPSWSTATYPATAGTANGVIVSDGTNFTSTVSGDVRANSINLGGATPTAGRPIKASITATDPSSYVIPLDFEPTVTLTANNANETYGIYESMLLNTGGFNFTSTLGQRSFISSVYTTGTGTAAAVIGAEYGFGNINAGTITVAYGVKINDLYNPTGTFTNAYGVWVGDLTVGTNTNTPFSFYASDANAYNYFAGNTGIATTAPTTSLSVAEKFNVNSSGAIVKLNNVTVPIATYSASNVTTDRTYDADSTSVAELADVLGTLIADLRSAGLVA